METPREVRIDLIVVMGLISLAMGVLILTAIYLHRLGAIAPELMDVLKFIVGGLLGYLGRGAVDRMSNMLVQARNSEGETEATPTVDQTQEPKKNDLESRAYPDSP